MVCPALPSPTLVWSGHWIWQAELIWIFLFTKRALVGWQHPIVLFPRNTDNPLLKNWLGKFMRLKDILIMIILLPSCPVLDPLPAHLPTDEGELKCPRCHLLVMAASAVWYFSDKTEIASSDTCISSGACQGARLDPGPREHENNKHKHNENSPK